MVAAIGRLCLMLLLSSVGAGCAGRFTNGDLLAVECNNRVAAVKYHRRGVRYCKHGWLKKAEAQFRQAIAADPTYGPAHNNLGRIQYERRDLYQAAWSFQRAIELMPGRGEPLNNLALTFEAAGRLDEAIDMYLAAASSDGDNPEYLGNSIRARLKRGDDELSVQEDLQRLVFLDSRDEWLEWADYKLMLMSRQTTARTPDELLPATLTPDSADEPTPAGQLPPPVDLRADEPADATADDAPPAEAVPLTPPAQAPRPQ